MSSRWPRRPTKSADLDAAAVTIGLRIQYTGTKALHFPRALPGVPEPVPKSLLQDVRKDLTAMALSGALPKDGNAHFSALMPRTVELVWPQTKAHEVASGSS
ncbi:hypothetical protein PENSPDRAFT_690932 [Peniophora sp. CONT]|nr:hypothetical protein PENSPDRAFT_690932 [Peniophora sp. CONT]